jgi:hypothetical protein
MPDSSEAKKAAPRMEFVGPDELRRKSLMTPVTFGVGIEIPTMFE